MFVWIKIDLYIYPGENAILMMLTCPFYERMFTFV